MAQISRTNLRHVKLLIHHGLMPRGLDTAAIVGLNCTLTNHLFTGRLTPRLWTDALTFWRPRFDLREPYNVHCSEPCAGTPSLLAPEPTLHIASALAAAYKHWPFVSRDGVAQRHASVVATVTYKYM